MTWFGPVYRSSSTFSQGTRVTERRVRRTRASDSIANVASVPIASRITTITTTASTSTASSAAGPPRVHDDRRSRAELAGAGFTDVELHELAFDERFEDFEALWGDATRTFPPIVLLRHELGPEAWPKVHDGVRAQLIAALGDGPYVQPMIANLGVARR